MLKTYGHFLHNTIALLEAHRLTAYLKVDQLVTFRDTVIVAIRAA